MSCLGVLFALTSDDEVALNKCQNDDELIEYIQETLEERWDEDWLQETDKSWDAIHRCFSGGSLHSLAATNPLNCIIFGGKILNKGNDYLVSYKDKPLVRNIADEISHIDMALLRNLYNQIGSDYGELSQNDFDYTWEWFSTLPEFYKKCADNNKSVIFTADQ